MSKKKLERIVELTEDELRSVVGGAATFPGKGQSAGHQQASANSKHFGGVGGTTGAAKRAAHGGGAGGGAAGGGAAGGGTTTVPV
jgi:hypothetical protein